MGRVTRLLPAMMCELTATTEPGPARLRRDGGRLFLSILASALAALLFACLPLLAAQDSAEPEVTTQESTPTFKMEVERNLVLVRVVVRDSNGKAIGNLGKDDFQLLDSGKPQNIVHFSAEVPGSKTVPPKALPPAATDEEMGVISETAAAASTPQRFLALFFDDVHLEFPDMARVRQAAEHYLANTQMAGDRVGIFTTSGEKQLDFTDNKEAVEEGLSKLLPRPIVPREENACPDVFDYQAYKIVHTSDPNALAIATREAFQCNYEGVQIDPQIALSASQNIARERAYRVMNVYQTETEYALRSLGQVIRRISYSPGQRNIVLVSPGFLTVSDEREVSALAERALRAGVVINSLDARGLYVSHPLGDASKSIRVLPTRADMIGEKVQLALEGESLASDVLRNLAYDTGGEFFHNSNDLDQGFNQVGRLAEYYYVLGFSPQNLKADGRFHNLKVKLANGKGLTIQARSGYFAPDKPADAAAQAKEEVERAVYSSDELSELPIEVHTQFFKLHGADTRLSILTRLDMRFVPFRKEDGRNVNNLKLVTALFDRDGKIVDGKIKDLEFRLLDGSLEKLVQSGLTTRVSFDVKPGTYTVRQVVRDSEGAHISALNRTVEIPF
jgi:VWFA-related protein